MNHKSRTNQDPLIVAEGLADVLERENTALRAMDMLGATRLLGEKTAAVAALEAALDALADQAWDRPRVPADLRERLDGLAKENQRLLERALEVQGHVVSLIARAAAREVERQAPRYGADGAMAARPTPVAFLARV